MDEVGFMVTHIDESGFLRFTTIRRLVESVDAQPPGNNTHTQGSENPWCDWFRSASCVNGKAKATTAVI